MSRTGTYYGGSTIIGRGSDWFTYDDPEKKKAKKRRRRKQRAARRAAARKAGSVQNKPSANSPVKPVTAKPTPTGSTTSGTAPNASKGKSKMSQGRLRPRKPKAGTTGKAPRVK